MNPLNDLFRLFFPERCACCGELLPEGFSFLCPPCYWDMPLTGYWNQHDNPVFRKFAGLLPIQEASSLLFFVNKSRYRSMIHGFKYHGQWRTCQELGYLYGEKLRNSPLYSDIDLIIPVPLHPRRLLRRGYNQSAYLAQGIAQGVQKPVALQHLKRHRYNSAQAQTADKRERWSNVEGIFKVKQPEHLAGKHILLVDDVLTTGATVISCGETLLRAAPTCRLSIVTLSVSANELFGGLRKGGL